MIPFGTLAELFEIASSRGTLSTGVPPTERSVKKIQSELGVKIPQDYLRLASLCPSYMGALGGVGEDYDNGYHILYLNKVFHQGVASPPLPAQYVLIDHGHDSDCMCWDTRETTKFGEHPIVYVGLEGIRPCCVSHYESFRGYIEDYSIRNAVRHHKTAIRRKAKRMIAVLGLNVSEKCAENISK